MDNEIAGRSLMHSPPESSPPALNYKDVSLTFTTRTRRLLALKDISFSAASGEFVSVVGPSGCGKSSLLSLTAGLIRPEQGTIDVLGHEVQGINKQVGIIFQKDALLPWRTALQNVALPLRFRGYTKKQAEHIARDWLGRVGLGSFGSSYPHQLSGGMRKRVAIATTLAFEPKVLLMDEPFSALDVQTRNIMETDLLGIWQESGQTVLFITHDLEEAITMSDRIVVLSSSPGTVIGEYTVGLDRPRELIYDKMKPDFISLEKTIWDQLKYEVLRANSRELGKSATQADDTADDTQGWKL
jgi:NitT/TauT family transport system ATP-binding protein